ncbi:MAG: tetratricopeptide repeat protein [Anaerolineae bacterium]|nr:tetratricopeptide repeat protein [Anaerolineae bacterium]
MTGLLTGPTCRLLTLVGPGGVGKTRLALRVAADLRKNFTHGVYFVPLQPLQSTDFLIPAIADALNIHLSGQQEPQQQLFDQLQDKEMLLLLDNFEHLIDRADLLTDLLRTGPALKFLVTSREALNLPEEWLFPLAGMPYPPDPQTEAVETYSAVQLFVGCAQRLRPDFSLADERDGVIRICQLVEGTPLALELAASWVKILNCTEIAAEIQRNLDFLATRQRGIPSRHQSMKAVFNHSYALLGPEEQAVFKRLAVFRGGFRRQAAERVTGASLVTLSALVDKSLLRWEANGRYQIHELLRQYAAEELVQSPEDVALVYDRHCRYFAAFLAERNKALEGGRQRDALREIEADLENIRAAWQWATEQLKAEEIQKSMDALGVFFDFRGRYLEGIRAFEQTRHRLYRQDDDPQMALIQAALGVILGGLYVRLGRLEEAETILGRSQELYRQFDMPLPRGYSTDPNFMLGVIASIRGDYAEAKRLAERTRQTSETQNHHLNRQAAYYLLGRAALLQGEYDIAHEYFQQAYALTQEIKDRWFMAYCLNELGQVADTLGHYEAAREYYTISYDLRKEFDDPEGMAVALNHLGDIAVRQQNYSEAQRLYRQSLALAQEINNRGVVAAARKGLGWTALGRGDYMDARHQFRQGLQGAADIQFVPLILSLLVGIGELLLHSGKIERGLELLKLVVHHPASDYETKQQAQQLVGRHQDKLSQESLDRGEQPASSDDLFAITAGVQAELLALFTAEESKNKKAEESSLSLTSQHPGNTALVEPLTERELEVLQLIANGLTNREIADRLFIVVGTVKAHNNRIYGKLGAANRVQALARARELDLL